MSIPTILLGYQVEWCEDKSQVRLWEKSRRIGASWVCAAEAVLDAARANGGFDSTYTSYNRENTREFINDCSTWVDVIKAAASKMEEHHEIDKKTGEEVLTYMIRFSSGHKIISVSSKPANLRNRKGRIIVDEAAFGPDLDETLKAAMGVLMWGGRVDILSTHNGVDSQFNKYVTDVRSGRRDGSIHKTTIEDAVADGLYRRICLVRGIGWTEEGEKLWLESLIDAWGDDVDEELRCIPKRSGGTYLPRLLLEDRMIDVPVLRFEAPEGFARRSDEQREKFINDWLNKVVAPVLARLPIDLEHCLGEDFGRTADITVLAPCTITKKLRRRIPFLVELRDTPFREQELVLNFVIDRLPRFGYGALDATGNGQYLAERAWQRYGESRIEQVHLTNSWYAENLPPVKAALEDEMMLIPRDADVLNDMLSFMVINGVPKLPDVRKPSVSSGMRRKMPMRHGDAAIGIVLAHYATRRQRPAYSGYQSAEKRPASATTPMWGGFRSRKGSVL